MLKFVTLLFAIALALFPRFVHWYCRISVDEPESEYDFIVVGAGTSGSVVASRLSEASQVKVLLVEAGDEDYLNFKISIPVLSSLNKFTDADWQYKTEVQDNLYGQEVPWPQGKVLGGSSAINAMLYVKGHPQDYDEWEKMGATNWSNENVQPYFKKLEDTTALNMSESDRGKSGPLKLSFPFVTPISQAFVKAGQEIGYLPVDYNSGASEGFHYTQTTTARGRRQTAAVAYLHPVARQRKNNLHILTLSQVSKVHLESDAQGRTRAAGIVLVRNNKSQIIKAKKEIILSGGSVGTTKLLLLSGIGPKQHLQQVKVDPVTDLPGVGENLQDHLGLSVCWVAKNVKPGDLLDEHGSRSVINLWDYFINGGKGPLGSNSGAEAHALLRSKKAKDSRPDIQMIMDSSSWEKLNQQRSEKNEIKNKYDDRKDTYKKDNEQRKACDFTITNIVLRTKSVGRIRLSSNDHRESPLINPNYLSHKDDLDVLVEGFRIMEDLEKTETFKKLGVEMNLLFDECEGRHHPRSRKCFEEVIKQLGRTLYHPVGVAKIGSKQDGMSVVNPRLKVYGVEGLRVADASVMPQIPSANTQASCYMIGEKAAHIIKEDWDLI